MTPTKMLAAQATNIGAVTCVEAPVPSRKPGDILLRTEAASICGSDLHMVGKGWAIREWPAPPGHPGHEAVARVKDPGESGFAEDDLVLTVPHIWNSMCFAQLQSVDAPHLLLLPSDVPIREALMAQQLGTVIFAAKRLPDLAGETCVVMGQGSAGLFWDYVLKRKGAERVIAIEPVSHRRRLGESFGADEPVDCTGAAATKAVMDLTGGIGAGLVVEAVGSTPTLSQAFSLVRDRGRVVLFGLPESEEPVAFDSSTFFKKRADAFTVLGAQDEPGLASFAEALELIAARKIDVRPVVSHTIPIEQVGEAFALAEARTDGVVKVSLSF
jgi:threonine dehydrogenase-like Zn-dependent dehydrogenase